MNVLTHPSCHKTIELHEKRHREIAAIIQSIQSLDGVNNFASLLAFTAASAGKILGELAMNLTIQTCSETRRRSERSSSGDAINLDPDSKKGNQEREAEWDDQSSTLNNNKTEEKKQQWNADARKAVKAERKTAKN